MGRLSLFVGTPKAAWRRIRGSRIVDRREAIRRIGTAAAAAAAPSLPLLASRRAYASGAGPPNIVVVLMDDMGYGDIGPYGQRTILTPNLDRMAADGIRFTNCYAGSPVCAASRCALMTGLHTGHGRFRGNENVTLQPQDCTVAEMLRAGGYTTGLIGKWQLGETGTPGAPNAKGFDYWFGYDFGDKSRNYYPTRLSKNGREVGIPENDDGKEGIYGPDLFTQKAVRFIRRNAATPFFLVLADPTPHANYEAYRDTGNGLQVPSDEPYSSQPWPQIEKNYAAMLTRMDRRLGRLLEELERQGVADNTAVFFTNDNGPEDRWGHDPDFFNGRGPLTGLKTNVFEGGIRVPMMARWPGRALAGAVSSEPWAFWDFLPTVAEMTGNPVPEGLDGMSVFPLLQGLPITPRSHFYWGHPSTEGLNEAVRMGRWKGIRLTPGAPVQLYDLARDLRETEDVAAQRPDLVARAAALMASSRTGTPPRLDWTHDAGFFADGVAPNQGQPDDVYRYEVEVRDSEGDVPEYVRVVISRDGAEWRVIDMQPEGDRTLLLGKDHFVETALPAGNYAYRFAVRDKDGDAVGLPTENRVGPVMPAPPYLTWTGQHGYAVDGVKPGQGEADSTDFQFRVLYRAHDADMPDYVRLALWRDGAPHATVDMDPAGGSLDPVEGIVYRTTLQLPEGSYEYQFLAADHHGVAGGAAAARTVGVTVESPDGGGSVRLAATPIASGGAEILVSLAQAGRIDVQVTNIAGRPVRALYRDLTCGAGMNRMVWNGLNDSGFAVPGGVYMVQVTAKGTTGAQARALARVRTGR